MRRHIKTTWGDYLQHSSAQAPFEMCTFTSNLQEIGSRHTCYLNSPGDSTFQSFKSMA